MRIGGKWAIIGTVLGLGPGTVVAPGTAHALTCAWDMAPMPAEGDTNVPTDALLLGYWPEYTRLEDPAGEPVALDGRSFWIARGSLPVLVPREPLQPNTSYTIVRDFADGSAPTEVAFTTGDRPSSEALEPPVLRASEPGTGTGFLSSPSRWLSLEFAPVPEHQFLLGDANLPGAPAEQRLPEITSITQLFVDVDASDENLVAIPAADWVSGHAEVYVGFMDCGFWPGGGDRQELRFASVDIAGHVSSWTQLGEIELPSIDEANAAAAAEQAERSGQQEAAARRNLQKPRSCSIGESLLASDGSSCATWLLLGAGLAISARRRSARR